MFIYLKNNKLFNITHSETEMKVKLKNEYKNYLAVAVIEKLKGEI